VSALVERFHPGSEPPPPEPPERPLSLVWLAIGCAAAAWIALVCVGETLTYWDDDMFFPALRGEPQLYNAVWPLAGRFFPLAAQEFTVLARLDPSGHLYRILAAVELLLALAVALRAIRAPGGIALVTLVGVAATPSVMVAHLALPAVERNQLLLVAATLYGGSRYLERGRPWAAALAAASSFLLLFYKETSPAIVGGASLWLFATAVRRRGGEWRRPLALSILFGIGVAIWLGAYLHWVYGRTDTSYLQGRAVSFGIAARAIITQAWLWALLAALAVRAARKRGNPVLDGLCLGAAMYGGGIAALGLESAGRSVYYIAPAAFVAWIYIAAAASGWTARPARLAAVAAMAVVIVASVPGAIRTVRDHKGAVGGKADAARFIADYGSARAALFGDASPVVLRFPAGGWAGGLVGGYVRAIFGSPVIVVPGGDPKDILYRCPVLARVDCDYARPRRPGDLVVTLTPGEEDVAREEGLAHLYASGESAWRDPLQRVNVFLVPSPPATSPFPPVTSR
jgi:hypothetical protein